MRYTFRNDSSRVNREVERIMRPIRERQELAKRNRRLERLTPDKFTTRTTREDG